MWIYKITNIKNNKCYVGQTIDIIDRWYQHQWFLENDKHRNEYLQNSWNKYGSENFKFTILEEGFTNIEELNKAEIYWIGYLDSMCYQDGYNIKEGGDNGRLSEETKRKISEANKGEKCYWFGKTGFDHHLSKAVMHIESKKIYGSVHEAERQTGVSKGTISKHCNHKFKTPKWRFVNAI